MRSRLRTYIIAGIVVLATGYGEASAQKYPERSDIRKGNRDYERARFEESEMRYRSALEKDPESFEAGYNLGNSLYRQGEWQGAEALFKRLTESDAPDEDKFRSHYNSGNAMFQQRKLQEALEEYKQALRIDPNDMEAKFNLAYVKKLLEDDDQDGDGDGGDNDDQQDNNDDGGGSGNDGPQDNNDGNDDQDNGQDPGQGDNNDGKGDPDPKDGQGQRPPGMTREEAENLLEAVQMNEDKTREKMDEQKAGAVQRSEKNW